MSVAKKDLATEAPMGLSAVIASMLGTGELTEEGGIARARTLQQHIAEFRLLLGSRLADLGPDSTAAASVILASL